jgi:hypothetical protein
MIKDDDGRHHPHKRLGWSKVYRSEYRAWESAKTRCYNPKSASYKNYGGRGIYMVDRWKPEFPNFIRDMGRKKPGESLDRIDTNGPYSPENCRWATPKQQLRNTRVNRYLTLGRKRMTLVEWAEHLGMHKCTIFSRIYLMGWSVKDALTMPVRPIRRYTLNGETHHLADWAKVLNVKLSILSQRARAGWSTTDILTTPVNSGVRHKKAH